jgi:hypothetical protein
MSSTPRNKLSRRDFGKLLTSIPVAIAFWKVLPAAVQSVKAADGTGIKKIDTTEWHINYQSGERLGRGDAPVVITYISGYTGKGSWRRKIGLQNLSSKKVQSVELTAWVCSEENPEIIIAKHTVESLNWPDGFAGSSRRDADGADNLPKMFESLLKDGKLHGYYRIEMMISKVVNADGSIWERQV